MRRRELARILEAVRALERLGLQAARGEAVIPAGGARGRAMAARIPVMRSGTALEVAELSWIAEGVSRELALSIPSVFASRNLIVGTVVQLQLFRYRGGDRLEPGYLLTKPDPSTTLVATIGGTVDELLFYGRAYWRILERDSEGFATRARWTPVADVTPLTRSTGGAYEELLGYDVAGVAGTLPPEDLIRFDSGQPGILDVGGRTLASAIELEQAARRFAGVELPAGVITNEGAELSQAELEEAARRFSEQRRTLQVAALQGWKYERADISPGDLQLLEARANVATDVARLFGVPVAMIAASPSGNAASLLYSNLSQQLAILVATAVAPHLYTIETALSDQMPRGQSCAFDVQSYLRSDPSAAAEYAITLEQAGLIDRGEARALLGIPSTTAGDLTPGKV